MDNLNANLVNNLIRELQDFKADAEKFRWLDKHSSSFSWNPSLYSENKYTGFSAFNTGYLGYGFVQAVEEAMKNKK